MRWIKLIFVTVLLVFSKLTLGQIYPVQLSAQLIPPYSGYLPDYADPSSEKLKVILQFNDLTTPQYNIRLRIEIKGNGFTLVTKQLFNPPPLTLQSGVPLLLSGADLAPYLNSNNFDFIGINQAQYEQRMALPEGYYSICVKAYDYYNPGNIQVSNEFCSQAWFILSDPPFLNLPQCGKNITPQNPQNILFQWTPMHMSSPNSAANTEYEFALWEVRPDSTANPNQVVLSTAPIFSTTTNLTLLNYGIAEPPLNLYMKYVWRVRAKDITGRDWFKNNGCSQICTFVYGNLQTVLGNALNLSLSAEGVTHRLGRCSWNTQSIYTKYLLQVRKAGTQNWFDYYCTTGFEKVNNLEPNTNYEARVRGEGSITGEWSNIATFNTTSEPVYGCNDQTQYADVLAAQPLPATRAMAGLVIQSGQFEVIATQIYPNGPPGWYSGKGYAKVFGALPLQVEFNNIYIDDNNRHQQGVIQAVTQGIDNWLHQWDVKDAEENANAIPGVVDSVYVNGNQLCVKIQGHITDSCFAFPPNQNVIVVRDENGNQWTVTVNPPPPTVSGPTNYLQYSSDELDANDGMLVEFEASPQQQYGFDKKKYTAWIPDYELIKLKNGKNYFVPYKSVKEFGNDEVYAKIDITEFDSGKLSFKADNGFQLTASSVNNTTYKITVPYQYKSVYAWYDGKKIGKLNVVSLKTIAKKLVVVPVGSANINTTSLQADLNRIFQQANVNWNVTVKSAFAYNLGNDGLKSADATLMSKYSEEMRALRDAYKQATPDYDKEAYYIFVVNNFDEPSLKGYMVRGRALGFVAGSATSKEIAHELAHGAFGLEHTFPSIAKNTSENLMDYGTGTELSKVQWEEVQNSRPIFNWLDNEEDGSLNSNSANCDISKVPQNLADVALSSIGCANDFDTKINAYNNQPQLLSALCLEQRINIVKCLVQGVTGDEDEVSIIEILRNTPQSQKNQLLIEIKRNGLLKKIISSTDGEEFYTLIEVLTAITYQTKLKPNLDEENCKSLINSKKVIYFDDWKAQSMDINPDCSINLKTRKNFHISYNQEILNVDPFSYVFLRFDDDFSLNNKYYPVGYYDYVPAIYIYGLFNESENRNIRLFIDGILLISGIGELNLAIQTGKGLTLALLDAGVAVSDITLSNILVDKLNSSATGKKVLHSWNTFAMCYGGVRAGPLILKQAKNFYIEAKKFLKTSPALSANEIQQLESAANEAKAAVTEIDPVEASKLDNVVSFEGLLAKWDDINVDEAKSIYNNLSRTELKGSKSTVGQSTILNEINASNTLVNPYSFAYPIEECVLAEEALFVRVHNVGNPNRPWLIGIDDFRKFTSMDDMIKKLALPILDNFGNVSKPTNISLVKLPKDIRVRKSVARPQDWPGQGHQPGGSIQYEIRGNAKMEWFKSLGSINDYLN